MTGNCLITGLSGTGKTTVGAQLAAMGYRVIEADKQLVSDDCKPWDGKPWVWDRRKVRRLLRGQRGVFVCGGAENQGNFLRYFDRVVELTASLKVTRKRLASRTISGPVRTKEHSVPGAIRIDATKSIHAIVYAILRG